VRFDETRDIAQAREQPNAPNSTPSPKNSADYDETSFLRRSHADRADLD
jgi:hypothetical protein